MPDTPGHLQQIQRNDAVVRLLLGGQHYSWSVTVLFYIAVHIVEIVRFETDGTHSSAHRSRKKKKQSKDKEDKSEEGRIDWFRHNTTQELAIKLEELKQASEESRYLSKHLSLSEFKSNLDTLDDIVRGVPGYCTSFPSTELPDFKKYRSLL